MLNWGQLFIRVQGATLEVCFEALRALCSSADGVESKWLSLGGDSASKSSGPVLRHDSLSAGWPMMFGEVRFIDWLRSQTLSCGGAANEAAEASTCPLSRATISGSASILDDGRRFEESR